MYVNKSRKQTGYEVQTMNVVLNTKVQFCCFQYIKDLREPQLFFNSSYCTMFNVMFYPCYTLYVTSLQGPFCLLSDMQHTMTPVKLHCMQSESYNYAGTCTVHTSVLAARVQLLQYLLYLKGMPLVNAFMIPIRNQS